MGISLTGVDVRSSGNLNLAALADSDVTIGEISNSFITAFGTEETLSIGSAASSNKLFVQNNDSTNTGITDIIGVTHLTSGTPGNGIGTGIGFNVEGAGGSVQGGRIASVLTDVTDDGEDSELRFFAMASGSLSSTSILSLATTGISGSAIKDEDNMSSDSATHLATQQSIKAYADSQGLSSANITLSSVANNDVLQYNSSSSKWVNRTTAAAGLVTLTGSETLTNKTLTSPVTNTPDINGGTADSLTSLSIRSSGSGAYDVTISNTENLGAARTLTFTLNNAARTINLAGDLVTSGGHTITFTTSGTTGVTLPTSGTLATIAGTETLTNKTLTSPVIATIVNNSNNLTLPTSADTIVGRATTDTLTNKTIAGGSNTLSAIANSSLSNSAITIGGTSTSLGGTITALTALTDLDMTSGDKTILDTIGSNTLTIGASGTTVSIAGNLTVAGTTTTVSSTTVTIADPIFNLGGTSAPGSDDNKDRGISFRWHNGSAAKIGFFGYDDSVGKFIFVPDATISSEVVSGTAGTLVATTFEGALSGNASTATSAATWTTARTLSFTGDVTGTGSVNGSADVATALTIGNAKIDFVMLADDIFTGAGTAFTSVDPAADYLLLYDNSGTAIKRIIPNELGVSGLAGGGSSKVQYANGTAFAGAANVEIKNDSLALKEQSTPSNVSGYGMLYAGTNNELYYHDDGGANTQITSGGSLTGGGVFQGVKAYLSSNTSIDADSLTTVSAWTEVFDVGGWHSTSTNTERFSFPVAGYYSIQINQTWALDNDGYREAVVQYYDDSGSAASVLLTDRVLSTSSETTSSSNATITVYVDDPNDYIYLQVRQTSGAALNLVGAADEMTSISAVRLDIATASSTGVTGAIQFSDGAGTHSNDASNFFWDDSNNRLGIGTNTPTTTLQVNGVATFESYLDFNKISAPSSPSAEDARMYLKEVDSNNNAIAVKLQKAGSIQEVEITSPGAVCGECGSNDGARDPIYDFKKGTMILNLFCGHSYEVGMSDWRRID